MRTCVTRLLPCLAVAAILCAIPLASASARVVGVEFTADGGTTLSDPTLLPALPDGEQYRGIAIPDSFTGNQYFEFSFAGGRLGIGATYDSPFATGDLALYALGENTPLASRGFFEVSGGDFANLGLSLAAGLYIVGFENIDPNGAGINFTPTVDGVPASVPEPSTLALFAAALVGFVGLRRRRA